ncbi:Unconventional myosin-VIIb like [Heracleum sosnowskyi]|uniref:Unconventional myosin-VIIb like n=1 Tax=Heracleum sosnowskyi TaxID=360622 RepID=A0AAD8HGA6_9APIA|nr:Unconventional myosin-VIIb like [Heracleum sosnowskyi]
MLWMLVSLGPMVVPMTALNFKSPEHFEVYSVCGEDYLFKSVMKISSIMKPSWFWVLLLMLGAALICISFTGKSCAPKSTGVASTEDEKDTVVAVTSRKLKYLDYSQVSGNSNAGSISPQDYGPVDPVPSSKASIQAGPIQHGTPLMPYIPPSPPAPSSP